MNRNETKRIESKPIETTQPKPTERLDRPVQRSIKEWPTGLDPRMHVTEFCTLSAAKRKRRASGGKGRLRSAEQILEQKGSSEATSKFFPKQSRPESPFWRSRSRADRRGRSS
ncbi:hypothetical protein Mapa_018696 [Marchantia paleacea]|nr:hypothetical protein Mapa_018696 [Marchantia paleacea]